MQYFVIMLFELLALQYACIYAVHCHNTNDREVRILERWHFPIFISRQMDNQIFQHTSFPVTANVYLNK